METTTSRIPPPDFFEGQTSENATIWLEQLEMYATINKLSEQQMADLGCNTDATQHLQTVLECICKIHLCDIINKWTKPLPTHTDITHTCLKKQQTWSKLRRKNISH